jgi:RimJ/RimL family protein N-acetyltransferase
MSDSVHGAHPPHRPPDPAPGPPGRPRSPPRPLERPRGRPLALGRRPGPPESVALLLDRSTRSFEQSGWGLWTLHLAADAPLIGVCGLAPFGHAPGVELLFSLAPIHRSKGLATEAATAVLTHAFQTLGFPL